MATLRMRICLNGLWERSEEGTVARPPDTGWQGVRVPEEFEDWSREAAWYRLRFFVPEEWAGQRLGIDIGRIRFSGTAHLNGTQCGESRQPRLPLQADVTEHIRFGAENELLVFTQALTNTHLPLSDPAARTALLDYTDTADMAGIFGDVVLSCRPPLAFTDVFIVPSVQRSELQIQATVRNHTQQERQAELSWAVFGPEGVALTLPSVTVSLAPGEAQVVETAAPWANPILWGPPPFGERVLYQLRSEIQVAGDLVDRRYDRFGFRELWSEGGSFRFNGRPLFLMGTHISGFESREQLTLLVAKSQEAGFLFVHPHADNRLESFYDVCDELGMLVWDAAYCGGPIGNWISQPEPLQAAHPYLADMYRGWIRRNRHHTCIVLWSAGCNNQAVNAELRVVIKAEDPSRLVIGYGDPEDTRDVLMFGFKGWIDEPNYSVGEATIDREIARRGARSYPLWIGEYWSQSGRPRALEITFEKGVAGGCTFDVGGYKGSLPPMYHQLEVNWPSLSGYGQRRQSLLLRGHKHTFPESISPNWCDPSQPVFPRKWEEAAGYRQVAERAQSAPEPPTQRVPEVIVTVTQAGQPVVGQFVFLFPAEGQPVSPAGVMTDAQGQAWFVLSETGRYRAVWEDREATFSVTRPPLTLQAGYTYIQRVVIAG